MRIEKDSDELIELNGNKDVHHFKPRRATVQERYRPAKYISQGGTMVPELCVRGLWLSRLGFTRGMQVVVDFVDDKLVISRPPRQSEDVKKAG
jgi:hypothetical protein